MYLSLLADSSQKKKKVNDSDEDVNATFEEKLSKLENEENYQKQRIIRLSRLANNFTGKVRISNGSELGKKIIPKPSVLTHRPLLKSRPISKDFVCRKVVFPRPEMTEVFLGWSKNSELDIKNDVSHCSDNSSKKKNPQRKRKQTRRNFDDGVKKKGSVQMDSNSRQTTAASRKYFDGENTGPFNTSLMFGDNNKYKTPTAASRKYFAEENMKELVNTNKRTVKRGKNKINSITDNAKRRKHVGNKIQTAASRKYFAGENSRRPVVTEAASIVLSKRGLKMISNEGRTELPAVVLKGKNDVRNKKMTVKKEMKNKTGKGKKVSAATRKVIAKEKARQLLNNYRKNKVPSITELKQLREEIEKVQVLKNKGKKIDPIHMQILRDRVRDAKIAYGFENVQSKRK